MCCYYPLKPSTLFIAYFILQQNVCAFVCVCVCRVYMRMYLYVYVCMYVHECLCVRNKEGEKERETEAERKREINYVYARFCIYNNKKKTNVSLLFAGNENGF